MNADAFAQLAARGVTVDREAFTKWSARRASPRTFELALVWACLQHQPAAVALLEADYVPQATRALRKLGLPEALVDDVLGWLRAELFVREGPPLLETWSGRGDLGSWIRAIATHEGIKRAKRARREVEAGALEDVPLPDAEVVALRGAHRAEFTRALTTSFQALPLEQRNLLRQYFLDGLTIDDLSRLLDVHRATAARRVTAAREALVAGVKQQLMAELQLGEQSVEEVITLSNLDESLSQLLRRTR